MKVLNLYAGIGGNRKLWEDVEVTAVEWDEETAKVYKDYFPDDKIIVGDAHQYLIDNYKEFDFIWSSPPCPSHSKLRFMQEGKVYPDMGLYQEILFLKHWFDGKWVVENVESYYDPLIAPTKTMHRHSFWCNFRFKYVESKSLQTCKKENERDYLEKEFDYDLKAYKGIDKRKALRNCVVPEIGLHILNAARNIITKSNTEQGALF